MFYICRYCVFTWWGRYRSINQSNASIEAIWGIQEDDPICRASGWERLGSMAVRMKWGPRGNRLKTDSDWRKQYFRQFCSVITTGEILLFWVLMVNIQWPTLIVMVRIPTWHVCINFGKGQGFLVSLLLKHYLWQYLSSKIIIIFSIWRDEIQTEVGLIIIM